MLEPRPAIVTLLLLASTALVACPPTGGSPERAPAKGCTKAYEQCELGNGVLGVCDVVACAPGATEPCLRCRSQH